MNIKELETVLTGLSAEFYQKDTQAIHNFFDVDRNNICTEKEFMSQLQKAERLLAAHNERLAGGRPGTAGTLRGTFGFNDRDDGMNQFIPGFYEATLDAQQEKLRDYILNELHQRSLTTDTIYSMADSNRTDNVKLRDILERLMKMLPNLTSDFTDAIP